ncbi:MAG: FG-GAP-like repeat-containing protein [Myxococcaceae bacterium]
MRAWALSRVSDVFGNAYEVAYTKDDVNGQLYPRVITYTRGPSLATFRTVEFQYESRTDVHVLMEAGALQRTTQRLKWIDVKSAGALVRRYRLDYQYGALTGRSQLVAVQEYGSDGASTLPAQTFAWEQGMTAPLLDSMYMGSGINGYDLLSTQDRVVPFDFDGDGRQDLLMYRPGDGYVQVSQGQGDGTFTRVWAGGGFYTYDLGDPRDQVLPLDFNGDGRQDLLFYRPGVGPSYLSRSNGDGTFSTVSATSGFNGYGLTHDDDRLVPFDFNGDGKQDILAYRPGGGWVHVNRSNGDGTFTRVIASTGFYSYDLLDARDRVLPLDFNADGRQDLLFYRPGSGPCHLYRSNGDGTFSLVSATNGFNGYGLTHDADRLVLLDFNGDGKHDIIAYRPGGGWIYVSRSNGDGTFTRVIASFGFYTYDLRDSRDQILPFDYNGDGKQDLVLFRPGVGPCWIYRSNGDDTFTLVSASNGFGAYDLLDDLDRILPLDVNGDGRQELLFHRPGVGPAHIYGNYGRAPDLMVRVNNGLGGRIEAEYQLAQFAPPAVLPASTAPGNTRAWPQQLLTRVTTHDGRGGAYATRYRYRDGRYLSGFVTDRRDLGFQEVEVTEEATGKRVVTQYFQTPGYEKQVRQVDTYAGSGALLSRSQYQYDLVSPSQGTELVRELSRTLTTFEPGFASPASTHVVQTTYDAYANPTSVTSSWDGLPTLVVNTQYTNDTSAWILGRPGLITTLSNGVRLAETTNAWTQNCLTARGEWQSSTNAWLTTQMTCDPNGNVASVTAPGLVQGLQRITRAAYDTTFRAYVSSITNALNHAHTFVYDNGGNAVSMTNPNGQTVTAQYDVFGRIVREVRPDGGSTEHRYENHGNVNTQSNVRIVAVEANRFHVSRELFDGTGFVYATQASGDAPAGVCETKSKDTAGRPSAVSLPHVCGTLAPPLTRTTYDTAGRTATLTTPDGKITRYTYSLRRTSIQDPNGQVTHRDVDSRDQLIAMIDPTGRATRYAYDGLGRMTSVTHPDGAVSQTDYDSLGQRTRLTVPQLGTTTYAYDDVGNAVRIAANGRGVSYTYDVLNRPLTKQPDGEPAVTLRYDDPALQNSKGRLTRLDDASGTTQFSYTTAGDLQGYVKWMGGSQYSQTFTYDLAGRVVRETYPDGSAVTRAYTDGGNLASVALNGTTFATWSAYSPLGIPGAVAYGNGVQTAYGMDEVGHVTSLRTTRSGSTIQDLAYDWYSRVNTGGFNLGAITDRRANKVVAGVNTDETQVYSYDALSRLTQAAGAWGTKSYAYDAAGNPTMFGGLVARTLSFTGQQLTSGTQVSGVTFDADGNMLRKTLDGTTWDYAWTVEGYLRQVRQNGALRGEMVYDASGNRTQKRYMPASGPSVTTTYVGQVYEKRVYGDSTPERHTLHIFAHGRRIASVTRQGAIATAFNHANRWKAELAVASMFTSAHPKGWLSKLTHLSRAALYHPGFASTVALTGFAAFVFLLLGLLRFGGTAKHQPRLRRPLRVGALLTATMMAATACGPDAVTGPGLESVPDYLISGDTTQGPALGTYFYHSNHVNSSSVITDATGAEVTRMSYLPFGEVSQANSSGSSTVTAKFTGQEYDEEFGLYYYGARYYDAAIGRFLSADSIVPDPLDGQAFNRYSYVLNNPIRYIDPSGNFNVLGFLAGVALFLAGVVAAVVPGGQGVAAILIASGVATMGGAAGASPEGFFGLTIGGGMNLGGGSPGSGSSGHVDVTSVGGGGRPGTATPAGFLDGVVHLGSAGEAFRGHGDAAGYVNPWPKEPRSSGMSWSDIGHLTLDGIGMIPVAGSWADALNAIWYAFEGQYVYSALSVVGVAPLLGEVVIGTKLGLKAGSVVLGHFPQYLQRAKELNARAFNVPTRFWDAMSKEAQWAANQRFLDRAIRRGDEIILTVPKKDVRPLSSLERELDYLGGRGYRFSHDGRSMIPPKKR